MKKFNFQNVVWKEGKYYVSQCLNIDISSFGKTKNEALKNLSEALDLYFEDAKISKIQEVKSAELMSLALSYA
ncbi:type II toxin-antitoxin system HicB family antitoxin [Candidatus Nomurabacteria bacterium]|nr:type II toxin-antitoxin system HicB family antitoxin [Candidatus Nomurabacteria bacterium]